MTVNPLIADAPWYGKLEGRADAVHEADSHLRVWDDLQESESNICLNITIGIYNLCVNMTPFLKPINSPTLSYQ